MRKQRTCESNTLRNCTGRDAAEARASEDLSRGYSGVLTPREFPIGSRAHSSQGVGSPCRKILDGGTRIIILDENA